jgi:hypothetical protein
VAAALAEHTTHGRAKSARRLVDQGARDAALLQLAADLVIEARGHRRAAGLADDTLDLREGRHSPAATTTTMTTTTSTKGLQKGGKQIRIG